MNSIILLNDFYNIYNNNNNLMENLLAALESSSNQKKVVSELQTVIKDHLDVLESLNGQFSKISTLLELPVRLGLSSQIDTVIGDLNNIRDALGKDDIDGEKLEQMFSNLNNSYSTYIEICDSAYKNYKDTLYFAFKTNAISLEDLEQMKDKDDIAPKQKEDIEQVIEKIKIELGPAHLYDVNMAEQTAIGDEKGKESSNTDTQMQPVANQAQKPQSLSERLENIEYQSGVNYADAVTEVRLEAELDKLSNQIERLKGKEKLTFSEAIQLQALIKQSLALEEMVFNQTKQQQRRETKMTSLDSKIATNAERLEQEKQNESKSNLFRYVSARKQQKLQEKLRALETKMAVIQTEQRMSTLVKFDKTNNKIARKAKRQATRQVIMTTTKENIEKIKAFGKKVVIGGKNVLNEGKNIASDVSRFVKNSQLMEKLRNRAIIMEGEPSILSLPEPEDTLVAHM